LGPSGPPGERIANAIEEPGQSGRYFGKVPAAKIPLSEARRRVAERLKRRGAATPAELASDLGLTEAAVRQHLDGLADAGLVAGRARHGGGRGRPAFEWALTDLARSLFPDRHAELTIELLSSLRRVLGDEGIDRVIADREQEQLARYRKLVPRKGKLRSRVEALADARTAEGYMAEVVDDPDGVVLIEHHCPIGEAATACQNFCRSELDVFRAVLGDDVTVERTQHALAGAPRCAYLVKKRGP
jgi:predicted ArsR family transcriptional regulator